MKLLKSVTCHQVTDGGNVRIMTVMGDALMDELSDAGSIPARSTKVTQVELLQETIEVRLVLLYGEYKSGYKMIDIIKTIRTKCVKRIDRRRKVYVYSGI